MKNFKSDLTKKEIEIINLLIAGLINEEIAERLELSPDVLNNYLSYLYEKFMVHNRIQLIIKALLYREG